MKKYDVIPVVFAIVGVMIIFGLGYLQVELGKQRDRNVIEQAKREMREELK